MNSSPVLSWLLLMLLGFVASQPLVGLEKQLLYSFQDPDEVISVSPVAMLIDSFQFEIISAKKRSPLLSLVGSNVRFTEPFRNRVLNKKKIRSVGATAE